MSQATIRIGKSTDNDYVIPADAPGVSRHHARLVRDHVFKQCVAFDRGVNFRLAARV